jgi:hypothetical protein
MPKNDTISKASIWGPEHWLPHTVTALALAILAGALAVIAGWWGLLQQALHGRQYTPLLLNTIGVLFLLLVVLSYSFYRTVKVLKLKNEIRIRPLVSSPLIAPPKQYSDEQHDMLTRLAKSSTRNVNVTHQGTHAILESLEGDLIDRHLNEFDAPWWELNKKGRRYLKDGGLI